MKVKARRSGKNEDEKLVIKEGMRRKCRWRGVIKLK